MNIVFDWEVLFRSVKATRLGTPRRTVRRMLRWLIRRGCDVSVRRPTIRFPWRVLSFHFYLSNLPPVRIIAYDSSVQPGVIFIHLLWFVTDCRMRIPRLFRRIRRLI